MSKAFTRESDDVAIDLPERIVSTYRNLVTPEGRSAIDAEIDRWSKAHVDALANDDPEAAARAARELRYWASRRATAIVAQAPETDAEVCFGSTVTVERPDGRRSTWRLVGEDEADPASGTLSHAAPVAREMMGKTVGEDIEAGAFVGTIMAIRV